MFKKLLLMKLEEKAKSDPKLAEEMFAQLMGKYKELTGENKNKALKDFTELYGMAEAMKLTNVLKYMNKFKEQEKI